jgi:hypothetical protein
VAQGTFTPFEEATLAILRGDKHDLVNDTIKVAIITNATVAAADDTTPTLSDYTEVSGTNYTAGGETVGSKTFTEAAGVAKFDGADVGWTQHASGFVNGYQAILYNDTEATDAALGFMDLTADGGSTPVSLQAGDIDITWGANGLLRISVA